MHPVRTPRRLLATGIAAASLAIAACSADRAYTVDQAGYSLLSPPSASLFVGATVPLTARVVRNGTDTISVGDASWHSSDTTIARIVDGPALRAMKAGSATIALDWGSQHTAMALTVQSAPVASVRLAPTSLTMVPGDTRALVATPLDANGTALADHTVTWSSSNTSVASVAGGTVTAVAAGSASVVASVDGITASAPVTVNPAPVASLVVTLNAASVVAGQTTQASAVARDARNQVLTGRTITWSSGNTAVATVDGSGLVRAVAAGSVNIRATAEGVVSEATLTVTSAAVASIVLQPASFTVNIGGTQQLQATLRDAAGNTLTGRTIAWSSGNTVTATVDGAGLARGAQFGTTTITASSEGVSQQSTVNVVPAGDPVPSVTPAAVTVAIGGSTTLSAIMRDGAGNTVPATFTWASANSGVATVDASSGRVAGVASGTVAISATANGKTASAQVTVVPVAVASVVVTPTSLALQVGATGQLSAACLDATGATLTGRTVTWGSNANGTATVNAVGQVTAVGVGTAQVTATCDGRTASATVTVTAVPVASVAVTPASGSVRIGSTLALTATTRDAAGNTLTGRAVTWTSSSNAIATVSSTGLVTPVAPGTATITATSGGISGTSAITVLAAAVASVTLAPGTLSLVEGSSASLTATARDASGNAIAGATFTWGSDDAATATVANGVVTAVRVGSTTVRATSGGIGGAATVAVSAAPVGGNIVDPTLLPRATGQVPATTSTYGRGLASGQTYIDPNSGVTVLKVTDNRVPVANSGMYHGYSEGGPFISQPWTGTDGATYYTLWLAWGDGWFVDVKYPAMTLSNWRAAPVSAEIEATFSLNPATPRIFYYSGSNTLNRYDTETNRLANTAGFPVNIPTSNGTYFTWIQTQLNDTWIVGMLGSNSTIVGVRPSDGTIRYYTTAATGLNIDEPHIDREQPVVYISAAGSDPQNVIYNLNTNTRTNPADTRGIVNDDHNAPMRGKIVGVSWQANATVAVSWQGVVTQVPGASPTNWAGDFHTAAQWVFNNPSEYYMLDQWQSGGNWPIALGMIGFQSATTGDTRLLVAHDGTGGGYQSGGQPHETFAPDGKLVMWTSNMHGSGRFDVFLAKVPTR